MAFLGLYSCISTPSQAFAKCHCVYFQGVPKADELWRVELWEEVGLPTAGLEVMSSRVRGSLTRHHSPAPTQVPVCPVTLATAMSALAEEKRDLLGF